MLYVIYETKDQKEKPVIVFQNKDKADKELDKRKAANPESVFSLIPKEEETVISEIQNKHDDFERRVDEINRKDVLTDEDYELLNKAYGIFMAQAHIPFINLCPVGKEHLLFSKRSDFTLRTSATKEGRTSMLLDDDDEFFYQRKETIEESLSMFGKVDWDNNTFTPHPPEKVRELLTGAILERIGKTKNDIEKNADIRWVLDDLKCNLFNYLYREKRTMLPVIILTYETPEKMAGQPMIEIDGHLVSFGEEPDRSAIRQMSLEDFVRCFILESTSYILEKDTVFRIGEAVIASY